MKWTDHDIEKTGLKIDEYRSKEPEKPKPTKHPKPKKPPKPVPILETYLQQQCVRFASRYKDKIMCEGTPAQAKRTDRGYYRMQDEGYITGSSDLKIYSATKFIFVELKREGMGKMSPAQLAYQDRCKQLGISYFVIDNFDNFVELIEREFELR